LVLNRFDARTAIAREEAEALACRIPAPLTSRISPRTAFASAARTGRLAFEVPRGQAAGREIANLAREIESLARKAMRRTKDLIIPRAEHFDAALPLPKRTAAGADHVSTQEVVVTAQIALDVALHLRSRIELAAIRRRMTVAQMLRDLLAREFQDDGERAP
jgi:chromosome partitioning protein